LSRSLLTALRNSDIKKLRDQGAIQLGVFDKVNMAEITSPDFPDERLAGLGVSLHQQYPVDERPVGLVDGLLWARSPANWIIGTTPEAIARWFDRSARLYSRSPASAVLIGYATGAVTSSFISPYLRREEPTPVSAWPSLDVMGREPEVVTAWTDMAAALDQAGDHHVLGTDHDGTLRIELGGPVLPWLLPGLAVRWFADIAQDEEGKRALRDGAQRVRVSGRPATLAEFRQKLPRLNPAHLTAWEDGIKAVASVAIPDQLQSAYKLLREAPIPWAITEKDRAVIDQAHRLMASTAVFDEPAIPLGSIMAYVAAQDRDADATQIWIYKTETARSLAGIGLFLVGHGDPIWYTIDIVRQWRMYGSDRNGEDGVKSDAYIAIPW
jgi:hypothetical protein